MTLVDYLKDKLLLIFFTFLNYILILTIILFFKGNWEIILLVTLCFTLPLITFFIID